MSVERLMSKLLVVACPDIFRHPRTVALNAALTLIARVSPENITTLEYMGFFVTIVRLGIDSGDNLK